MGHQVNFHLTPTDTSELEARMHAVGPMVVLHSRSATGKPRILENLDLTEGEQPWLYYFLVRPDDLDEVAMHHVPAQGYWTVDVLKSPVIEFNRCFFDGKLLRRGRVYYADSFYSPDNQMVLKSEAFRKWGQSILRVARKGLKKNGLLYIGRNAGEWLATSHGELAS